jgi:hypothetical protein
MALPIQVAAAERRTIKAPTQPQEAGAQAAAGAEKATTPDTITRRRRPARIIPAAAGGTGGITASQNATKGGSGIVVIRYEIVPPKGTVVMLK